MLNFSRCFLRVQGVEQQRKGDEEYAYVSSLKITDSIKYLNLGILKHTVWTYVLVSCKLLLQHQELNAVPYVMPRLLIFIRYERRSPILILNFNHYFIWQSKHYDDSQYLDSISAPAAGTFPLTFSLFLSSLRGKEREILRLSKP